MIALDTNVLVRFLVDDDAEQVQAARTLLESLTAERPAFICREVMIELVWVLERAYRLPRDRIAAVLEGLIATEGLGQHRVAAYTPVYGVKCRTGVHGGQRRSAAGAHRAHIRAGRAVSMPRGFAQQLGTAARRRPRGTPGQRQDSAAPLVRTRLRPKRTGRRCRVAHAERRPESTGAAGCPRAAPTARQAASPQDRHRFSRLGGMGLPQRPQRLGRGGGFALSSPPVGRAARRSPHAGPGRRHRAPECKPGRSRRWSAVSARARRHAGAADAPGRHERLLLVAPGRRRSSA